MLRSTKWIVPAIALAFVLTLSVTAKAADEKGGVSVTVNGKDGKPAAGVDVMVNKPPKAAAAIPGSFDVVTLAAKPETVAQGTTDAAGKCELKDIPVGDYNVVARNKADKTTGRAKVTIEAGKTATVSIELKEPKAK